MISHRVEKIYELSKVKTSVLDFSLSFELANFEIFTNICRQSNCIFRSSAKQQLKTNDKIHSIKCFN